VYVCVRVCVGVNVQNIGHVVHLSRFTLSGSGGGDSDNEADQQVSVDVLSRARLPPALNLDPPLHVLARIWCAYGDHGCGAGGHGRAGL